MNNFIKSLMDEKNLNQRELAEMLGISPPAVSQWMKEGANISIDCLFSLSKLFHVTVDELLDGKRTGESLEDKWKREYDINEEAARTALINGEREKVLKYFTALQRANSKFFELFERKVAGNVSDNEIREWEYLSQFYDVDTQRSCWLINCSIDRSDAPSETIINALMDKLGKNNTKAIVWELQKIYHITHYGVGITADIEIVPRDDYFDDYGDDPLEYLKEDEDVFFAVYASLSPLEKDQFTTSAFKNKSSIEYLYELIKRGGKILYTRSDLNITNYDEQDLVG
ncbi:MAG: helix-turn-helix transcriptional regulator, partial [Clostridia bacterium]|nr:helix-turn-helix transcriptional regulator [Clostridia bacterium]